eukprot:Clim_evm42s156 gene=Clim_evmTU42s156
MLSKALIGPLFAATATIAENDIVVRDPGVVEICRAVLEDDLTCDANETCESDDQPVGFNFEHAICLATGRQETVPALFASSRQISEESVGELVTVTTSNAWVPEQELALGGRKFRLLSRVTALSSTYSALELSSGSGTTYFIDNPTTEIQSITGPSVGGYISEGGETTAYTALSKETTIGLPRGGLEFASWDIEKITVPQIWGGTLEVPQAGMVTTSQNRERLLELGAEQFGVKNEVMDHNLVRRYRLKHRFAAGAFGEIWRALEVDGDSVRDYVLKRMFLERGSYVFYSGLREAFFSHKVRGFDTVVPCEEIVLAEPDGTVEMLSFSELLDLARMQPGRAGLEMWLLYPYGGVSLHRMLYDLTDEGGFLHWQRSETWRRLRDGKHGLNFLKNLMRGLFEGVKDVHSQGILHRDLKPDNILIGVDAGGQQLSGKRSRTAKSRVRLVDFGSAVAFADGPAGTAYDLNAILYPIQGPSTAESTLQYAPPEVTFGITPFSYFYPESYDMWSLGVILLETILGTPSIYDLSDREMAILNNRLPTGMQASERQLYATYRSLQLLCVAPVNASLNAFLKLNSGVLTDDETLMYCDETTMQERIKQLDTLHQGAPSASAVDLLRHLLSWDPALRPNAARVLGQHVFFNKVNSSLVQSEIAEWDDLLECHECGAKFGFKDDYEEHLRGHEH